MQAIEIGINNYILKPIEIEQIYKVVDKSIAVIRSDRIIAQQNAEIRQLNKDLARKTTELEHANSELESYDYSVAHDLRSPIVSISGYSQILLDRYASQFNGEALKSLTIINQEVVRMNNFIGALLKLSVHSRKHVDKYMTNLSIFADEIAKELQQSEPNRQVLFCIGEGICGYCDPTLIRIVLKNLLSNAWKYTCMKDDVRIEFGTIHTDEDQVYFVRDNGSGFDDHEAEKIFTPFQRLQGECNVDGFGIGLASTRRIIARHGGRVWAEGKKGEGATFYFTL
jgi:light-regulated signal transduction histidine kinase (bacteriophytochrome)